MITGKIDLTKLPQCEVKSAKGRDYLDITDLYHGSTGAVYLDFVLWESENDKFGNDYRITESLSKEDREAGTKAEIIGNAKIRGMNKPTPRAPGRDERQQGRQSTRQVPINEQKWDEDSPEVPF